ncbi:MAG: IS1182 family transposase, partial [Methylacidiphilales bacterium]|nr:IS1182 family transposase [Candidatus Methylacidiphilales bacterium]
MLTEAETTDASEDRLFADQRGDELPADLATSTDRLTRLKACKEKLERAAAEAAA